MTTWAVNLGKRLEAYHVAARSHVVAGCRMVKMGLAVASIVVPALRVHADSPRSYPPTTKKNASAATPE